MSDVKILDGNTFVVSDDRGDIEASLTDPTGLFSFDTRYLSKWVLTIDGQRLNPLSVDDLQYFETRFFLVPGTGTVYIDAKLSVIRQRAVGDGFHEELTILNHDQKPADLEVRIEAGSDFADLFEVKDDLKKQGEYYTHVDDGRLVLGYRRDTYVRETWISATAACAVDERGLTFSVHVEPGHEWTTDLHVTPGRGVGGSSVAHPKYERHAKQAQPIMERSLDRWLDEAPRLTCDWDPLNRTYQRSLVDLAALRFSPVSLPGHYLPAAGLPWFMTMFGRDSIFTSLQALPFTPELAKTTLLALGMWQGSRTDDFRDEDPGRILHELRFGEMTAFEERPHSPYYGSVDATPLYVVLLDEYERWTGDVKLVKALEHTARAALAWIDDYADLQGNGYIAYKRRNEESGLENQCWKDSWDSISYRDGRLPGFPRATCELQGRAGTPTTPRCAAPGSRARCGAIRPTRSGSRRRRRSSSAASTATSGSRTDSTTRSPSRPTAARSTPWPRTTAISCGAGSSTSRRPRPSPGTSCRRRCTRAGACAPCPRTKLATTRSATTSARCGPSTARSSPGASAATDSRRRRRASPPASSTPPSSSTAACRRRSAATRGS